jgi:hypothetical protein
VPVKAKDFAQHDRLPQRTSDDRSLHDSNRIIRNYVVDCSLCSCRTNSRFPPQSNCFRRSSPS